MKLKDYLSKHGVTKEDFAFRVGCSVKTVYNWLAGTFIPSWLYKKQIEDITSAKVAIKDWETTDEPKKETNKRVRGSKADGMQSPQRVGANKKTKPKSGKAKR